LQPRQFIVAAAQFFRPIGVFLNLVEQKYFSTAFYKFISKRDDGTFCKIKVIQIDIQDIFVVRIFLTEIIEQKSGFSDSPESFNTNQTFRPVDAFLQLSF
jgi:hypothetical protein